MQVLQATHSFFPGKYFPGLSFLSIATLWSQVWPSLGRTHIIDMDSCFLGLLLFGNLTHTAAQQSAKILTCPKILQRLSTACMVWLPTAPLSSLLTRATLYLCFVLNQHYASLAFPCTLGSCYFLALPVVPPQLLSILSYLVRSYVFFKPHFGRYLFQELSYELQKRLKYSRSKFHSTLGSLLTQCLPGSVCYLLMCLSLQNIL